MKRYILYFLGLYFIHFCVWGQSSNDNFANAIQITNSTTRTGSTTHDNSESGLATSCGYNGSSKGVWYKIPSSVNANVEVNTCSEKTLDTKLHVYKGTSIGSLTCIGHNDDTDTPCTYYCNDGWYDGGPGRIEGTCTNYYGVSKVTFTKNEGDDYYVLLTGLGAETGSFTIKFIIDHTPVVATPKIKVSEGPTEIPKNTGTVLFITASGSEISKEITVKNESTTSITLMDCQITGTNPSSFTSTGYKKSDLGAGISTSFNIKYIGKSSEQNATVSIPFSTDNGTTQYGTYNFKVKGRPPAVFHVSTSPNGTQDGSSWNNTMSLQSALETVQYYDKIWVKAGTYKPTKDKNDNTISGTTRTFVMRKGVAIYGGFPSAGNPTFADRDWINNPTILSGDMGATDNVTTTVNNINYNNTSDNINRIINNENNDLNQTAILDGFTLKGSRESGLNNIGSSPLIQNCIITECYHRAVYNQNSSPKYINCTFNKNGKSWQGGALFFENCTDIEITNCVFKFNYGSSGGAIHQYDTDLTITNCTFSGNYASSGGGAIYASNSGSPTLTLKNSIFYGNTSPDGNNLKLYNTTTATFCLFKESSAFSVSSNMTDVGNNIFGQDPLFEDATNGDLRLKPRSPAINKGNNTLNAQSTDVEGNPRIYDKKIDMGAYENPSPNIQIKEGTTFITSGETLFFTATSVTETKTQTLTIENIGTGNLFFTGAKLEIEGSEFASVVAFTSTKVASSASMTLDVKFSPSDLGVRTGRLKLYSNDTDESPYIVNLRGWSNVSHTDSLALRALYHATNGTNWNANSKWDMTKPITQWKGVTTDKGRVIKLDLAGGELSGKTPDALGNLEMLEELDLSNNNLVSYDANVPFTTAINKLENLRVLRLGKNLLTGKLGPIATHLDDLLVLGILDLSSNQFDGSIPNELTKISVLEELYLNENQLSGSIPTGIKDLLVLQVLNLADNQISGKVPNELNEVTNLNTLELQNNSLSGNFPSIKDLTSLRTFSISNNQFEGTLPDFTDFTLSSSIQRIKASNNLFTNLPDLSSLKSGIQGLIILQVAGNQFYFDDLLPNKSIFTTASNYAPQQEALAPQNINIQVGDNLYLNTELSGAGNQYQWYKGGTSIAETNKFVTITNTTLENAGIYNAHIKHPDLLGLTLIRKPITVQISAASINIQDYNALMAFCTATGGENWSNKNTNNWGDKNEWGNWEGVTINNATGRVTAIRLSDNNLRGDLPSELKNLTQLEVLDLQNNYIKGEIPKEIASITLLKELYLQENEFIGEIPKELGDLPQIQRILLNDNKLSGELPKELQFTSSSLRTLHLHNNNFKGTIPNEWTNLSKLKELYLYNNKIEGAVPLDFASVGKMPDLRKLRLQSNLLTDIPDFSKSKLERLDVEENFLTFENLEPNAFISSFSYAPQAPVLDTLRLEKLYGDTITISSEIAGSANIYTWYKNSENTKLGTTTSTHTFQGLKFEDRAIYWATIKNSKLTKLTLRRSPIFLDVNDPKTNVQDSLALVAIYEKTQGKNWTKQWDLEKPVYTWEGVDLKLGRVTQVILNNTNLTGEIPKEVMNLPMLQVLDWAGNNLKGEIPALWSGLDSLREINMKNNELTGNIPDSMGTLIHLERVDLSGNKLDGELPKMIQKWVNLWYLNLANNTLSGELPEEIGKLEILTFLELQDNNFTGSLPQTLGNLTNLQELNLANNRFTETIPEELGKLTKLEFLKLNNNRLSGKIPASLSKLSVLTLLDLHSNGLEKNIPTDLGQLTRLKELYLHSNNLDSTIPSELGKLSELVRLNLSENQFTGTIPSTFNKLTQIKSLLLEDNRLTGAIPDLSSLKVLEQLSLANNDLTGIIPSYFTALPNLTKLEIQSNGFTKLPDFSKQLDALSVEDNNFLFSDLEPNRTISKFTYSPQADLDSILNIDVVWGTELKLSVTNAGGSETKYQWTKNSENLGTASASNELVINPVDYSDAGEYLCRIRNKLLSQLTLVRQRIVVKVLEPDLQVSDIEVLKRIYNTTDGDNWKTNANWKKADGTFDIENVKTWYGVTVVNDRVTELNLQNNQLNGTLTDSIRFLTNLKTLRLSGNTLKGNIPTGVQNLTNVIELDLSNNQFTGTIPAEIGKMRSLIKLNLQGNQFDKNTPIPEELSQLSQLQELDLSNNNLGGSVPTSFGKIPQLSKLILSNNNLDVLPNLSSLSNLSELQVQNNYLNFKHLVPNNFVNTYRYSPQKKTSKKSLTTGENTPITLSLDTEVLEDSSRYEWRKKASGRNVLSTKATYEIQSPIPEHTGDYECIVTNNVLPNLTLIYEIALQVIPSMPKVITPKPYCSADESVTLFSDGDESDETNWYDDEKLTKFLGKGQKLRLTVTEAHRTVYAVIRSSDNESQIVAVPIIRRPVINLNGNQLKTDIGNGLTYEWRKDGKVLVGENTETLTVREDGIYKVRITTTEGCSASSAVYQLQNGQSKLVTSIEQEKAFETSIYPNPFTEQIEVRFDRNYGQKVQVQLMGMDGKIYFEKSMIGNAGFIIKAPELAQGAYFLHLKMGDRKIVRKIIKE